MRYDNPNFVSTFESYSPGILIGDKSIAVPYISANLMPNNPINKQSSHIDICYYVFNDVASLNVNGGTIKFEIWNSDVAGELMTEYIDVGYMSDNAAEVEICFKQSYIIIPDTALIRTEPFKPVDTPNGKANMDADAVAVFLNYIPSEVKALIGGKYFKLLL